LQQDQKKSIKAFWINIQVALKEVENNFLMKKKQATKVFYEWEKRLNKLNNSGIRNAR
jgi:hypothetical protein